MSRYSVFSLLKNAVGGHKGWERAWRDQEPINAHSHFAAMLLGSSETVPVTEGGLVIGQWQSVMLVDTDGPRERKVGIQCLGFK